MFSKILIKPCDENLPSLILFKTAVYLTLPQSNQFCGHPCSVHWIPEASFSGGISSWRWRWSLRAIWRYDQKHMKCDFQQPWTNAQCGTEIQGKLHFLRMDVPIINIHRQNVRFSKEKKGRLTSSGFSTLQSQCRTPEDHKVLTHLIYIEKGHKQLHILALYRL
jgi:hypothetical protein